MTENSSQAYTPSELPQVDINNLAYRIKIRWALVAFFVILGCVISLLYTAFAPSIWEADTSLYFPVKPVSIVSSMGNSGAGGLGSLLSGGSSSSLDIFRGFLDSYSALEIIANKCNISTDKVLKVRRLETDMTNETLAISVTSTDKDFALNVVKANLDAISIINARTQGKFSKADVTVITQQVEVLKAEIAVLQSKLLAASNGAVSDFSTSSSTNSTDFSSVGNSPVPSAISWTDKLRNLEVEKTGVDAQIQLVQQNLNAMVSQSKTLPVGVPAVTKLEPQLVDAETQLRIQSQYLGPEAPQIRRLNETISGLKSQIEQEVVKFFSLTKKGLIDPGDNEQLKNYVSLISQRAGLEAQIKALRPIASSAPQQQIHFETLTANLKLKYELLGLTERELLAATTQMMHDPVTWNVLDPPYVKEIPVNKHWLRNLADGIAAGLLIGLIGAIRKPAV